MSPVSPVFHTVATVNKSRLNIHLLVVQDW